MASWGVFYIHQRGCKRPWLLGGKYLSNTYKWQFKGSLKTYIYIKINICICKGINYIICAIKPDWANIGCSKLKYHRGFQMCKSVTEHHICKDVKTWAHPVRTRALLQSSLQATCGVISYISMIHLHTPEIEAQISRASSSALPTNPDSLLICLFSHTIKTVGKKQYLPVKQLR